MTVIPAGTGNDFLKNFGPDAAKFSDPEHLWDGPEFPLDLIDCNGRLCLTIACSGIDARIADTVHRYGNVPASPAGELPAVRGGEFSLQAHRPPVAGGAGRGGPGG